MEGLKGDVEILRDANGVPFVYASHRESAESTTPSALNEVWKILLALCLARVVCFHSEDDLCLAQGFLHAVGRVDHLATKGGGWADEDIVIRENKE